MRGIARKEQNRLKRHSGKVGNMWQRGKRSHYGRNRENERSDKGRERQEREERTSVGKMAQS